MVTGCHWLHVYHVSSKIWWKQRFDHPLLRGSCRFLPKLLLGYHRLQVEHLWSWPALHPLYKWVDDIYHQLKSCPFSNFRNFDGIPWLKRISLLIGGYLKHLWWGIQQVWDLVSSAMLFFMNYAIISQFYFITFIYIYINIIVCVCVSSLLLIKNIYPIVSHSPQAPTAVSSTSPVDLPVASVASRVLRPVSPAQNAAGLEGRSEPAGRSKKRFKKRDFT